MLASGFYVNKKCRVFAIFLKCSNKPTLIKVRPSSLYVSFNYLESSHGFRVGTTNATDKRHLKFHKTQAGIKAQQAVEVRSGRPSLLKNVVKRFPSSRWRHSRRFVKQTDMRLTDPSLWLSLN